VERTDEQIAKQVQKGDAEAFAFLVARYKDKLLRYARKFLSGSSDMEDLVQEVFIKAYINIKSFNTDKKFSPWIYRIAHNEYINALKRKKFEPLPFFDSDTLFPHPVAPQTADQDFLDSELKQSLDKILVKLDKKYREPLVLYYFQELSYDEIAEILHIPTSTVGVRLRRAKQMLKKYYDQLEK